MGAGKFIAIIGGILGIVSVALFYVLPELFCFWRLESAVGDIFLGGFGFSAGTGLFESDPEYTEDILLLITFTLVVAGGALAIIGGLIESKIFGILGGIIMLAGPIFLLIGLFIEMGDFEDLATNIAFLFGGEGLIMGSAGGAEWGIWISTYFAFGAGALGLIGGALID